MFTLMMRDAEHDAAAASDICAPLLLLLAERRSGAMMPPGAERAARRYGAFTRCLRALPMRARRHDAPANHDRHGDADPSMDTP